MRLEEFRKAQSGGRQTDKTDNYPLRLRRRRRTTKEGFFRWFCCWKENGGEVFIASSSSLRSRQFAPAKRGGEQEGRKEEKKQERERGKSPRVLPLFRCVLGGVARVGDLAHFTHQLFHPSDNEPRFKFVVVANFCVLPTPHYFARSGRGKNTKGALRRRRRRRRRRVEDGKPREGESKKKVK